MLTFELLVNTLVAGILLGGFYAAVSLGLSIVFGLLDVVNIAHPVFVMTGSYAVFAVNSRFGFDPLLIGVAFAPLFFFAGVAVYRFYHYFFERQGSESLRGLVFFFGLLFLIEVSLILIFGVDYRFVRADYIGESFSIGVLGVSFRLLVPFVTGVLLFTGVYLLLSKTFLGRAIMGVSQDSVALQLMGADPIRVKSLAFGLGIATASIAGALLIILLPVEPALGREYIGRVFAVVVLGGMGSIPGTLLAAIILGVAESLTASFYGAAWSQGVSFGILLLVLAIRPAGLFGR